MQEEVKHVEHMESLHVGPSRTAVGVFRNSLGPQLLASDDLNLVYGQTRRSRDEVHDGEADV